MKCFPKADYPIGAHVKVMTVWNTVVDGVIASKRTYDDGRTSYDVQINEGHTSVVWVTPDRDPFAEAAAQVQP